MPDSDLVSELRRRAERTAESIRAEARTEAERVTREAEQQLANRRSEAMRAKEETYRREARRAIAGERHAAMREVLQSRARVVDEVLSRARALMSEAAQSRLYRSTIEDELQKALRFVDDTEARVRCSPDVEDAVRTALGERAVSVLEVSSDLGSGFVVVNADRSVFVDCRLASRIDRMARSLAIEVNARLQEI